MTSLLTSETVNLSEHIAERLIYPSFSPDNQQIACLSENSLKIYQVKSNRLIENTEIPGSFRTVSWSPHNKDFGSHIAVEDNARRISIFTLAVPESKTVIGSGRFPTWSPDGTKIAYISGSELYVLQTLTTLYNVARE